MLLPDFLPSPLHSYQTAENDEQLLKMLTQNLSHFVAFFKAAANDETWSDTHNSFMQNSIEWFTKQFINEKLPLEHAQDVVRTIQTHSQLKSLIPHDIHLRVKKQDFPVNSMLIGVTCPYLRDVIRIECYKKKQAFAECPNIPYPLLFFINELSETGTCSNLWKQDYSLLIELLKIASEIQLDPLSIFCQEILQRYINRNNAFEMLLEAHIHRWSILKQHCQQVLNSTTLGLHFFDPPFYDYRLYPPFGIEFLNFQDAALDTFKTVKSFVTDLTFTGDLTQQAEFSGILQACPRLVSVNIGHTSNYSERFRDIPSSLQELDLSASNWLNDEFLNRLIQICPHLTLLSLSACFHVTFRGFGELKNLKRLRSLDISRCGFLDEDFILILQSCEHIAEFNLSDCPRLTDQSFFELARQCPQLEVLDISKNPISDGGLAEITSRCRHLRKLDVTRCMEMTDRGLLKALKFALNLKELTLVNCRLQKETIEEIIKTYPFIKIIF